MNHAQLGLSNDELLSTTRAVRKRLDLERSLSMDVVKNVWSWLCKHRQDQILKAGNSYL